MWTRLEAFLLWNTSITYNLYGGKCYQSCTQNAEWVHFCTQNTVATIVYTFPLAGYNCGDSPKPWTQFHTQCMQLATKAHHPYVRASIAFQRFLLYWPYTCDVRSNSTWVIAILPTMTFVHLLPDVPVYQYSMYA